MSQVFIKPRKALRQSRPVSERVPPLIFAPCHLAADVILRAVGVKRDIRPFEGAEQLDLVGVEPGEQPVEGGKAGGGGEQLVKAGLKLPLSARSGIAAICLQVGVEPTPPAPGSAHTPAAGGG